jgi:hypothetical protein
MTAELAASLARPVVRGWLPINQAEAALAASIARAERAGTSPGIGALDEKLAIERHILQLYIDREEQRRADVAHQIWRVVRPLILAGADRYRARAEAHDVNAANDFCFSEPEVEQVLIGHLLAMQAQAQAKTRASAPPWRPRRYHV